MTDQTEETESKPAKEHRYVAHVPFAAPDLNEAKQYARMLVRTLDGLPEVDAAGATLSEEGDSSIHYQLICDRRLDGGRRCILRADHETPCSPRRNTAINQRRI